MGPRFALAAVLALACGGATGQHAEAAEAMARTQSADGPAPIPDQTTPAAQLEPGTLQHTLLVKIHRNFGKQTFAIALDGWVDEARPGAIAHVRLWWLKTNKNNERGPFSRKSSKHFDVRTQVVSPEHWKVHLDTKSSRYTFDVMLESGKLRAYATVVDGGSEVQRCRASRGLLRAKKLLGAPVGIDALELTCQTPDGKVITAPMKPTAR